MSHAKSLLGESECSRIVDKETIALQGGSLPAFESGNRRYASRHYPFGEIRKEGGGADGYIPYFKLIVFSW